MNAHQTLFVDHHMIQPGKNSNPHSIPITSVGTVVEDDHVIPRGEENPHKTPSDIQNRLGGGVLNASRAIRSCGGSVNPIFLVGRDSRSDRIVDELGDDFPTARFVRITERTRRSVIVDGRCYTTREPLPQDGLRSLVLPQVHADQTVLVAPFPAENADFVEELLRLAGHSIWQPSGDQLNDPLRSFQLMNLADVTIFNHLEAELLTGTDNPIDAIMVCRERMERGIIITSPDGAVGWCDGNWSYAPAVALDQIVHTTGAGNTFAGAFALSWAGRSQSFANSIRLGQAAAARYVGQLGPAPNLEQLSEWYSTNPKSIKHWVAAPPPATSAQWSIAFAVSLGMVMGYWLVNR
jgi:sugar/nucleoside kinase (ribokinase family)